MCAQAMCNFLKKGGDSVARIKTYSSNAITDTHFYNNRMMRDELLMNGWSEHEMQRDNANRIVTEPFIIFHREIVNKNYHNWNKNA